jgi:3-methyladenine DNA glycosylase AlkC
MAAPLKTFFCAERVERLAEELSRAEPSFPSRAFIAQATQGLDDLELLDRGRQIARAMRAHLPLDDARAVDVLLRSLGPEHATDELLGLGMAPFHYLPHTIVVAEHGLDDFERSFHALYELTKRFTAEASIRAFLAKDPERTFAQLAVWTTDDNAHVRRLVSEGTRLRLPWAPRVAWLDANPRRVLTLLQTLRDDPATLVRRSVANNLNDMSKVHPELVLETCHEWLRAPSSTTPALVRHALRTRVKRGDTRALALLGAHERPAVEVVDARLSATAVPLGGDVRVRFGIRSTASHAQHLIVDYAIHYVKARGATHAKVFKLKRLTLAPDGSASFDARISLATMTTRRHYPGCHRIEAIVNGVAFPLGAFDVCRA